MTASLLTAGLISHPGIAHTEGDIGKDIRDSARDVEQEDVIGQSVLAVNAIIYLTTCLIAYWALRTRKAERNYQLERIADGLFLLGLTFTPITTVFITFAMSTGRCIGRMGIPGQTSD